jgi:O-antigen ligase
VGRGLPIVRITPELLGVAAMALVMVATVPFSIWPGGALGTFTDVFIKVVLVFLLMIDSVRAPRTLRGFSWVIVVAMGYVAARGVLDYVRGINLIRGERLHGSISGLMGNPNDLAMNLVTFLPLAIAIALGRGRPLPRLFAGFIALLMAATIVFTKSRAGLLGLAAMGLVFVLQARKLRPGLGVATLLLLVAAAPLMPASLWSRVGSIVNAEEDETGSRQARKDLMWEGWRAFTSHPLTGVGAGQFKNYTPPDRLEPWRETHNVLLQIAAELGIGGLLAFLFLIYRAVVALRWTDRAFSTSEARRPPPELEGNIVPVTDAFLPDERAAIQMHVAAMWASLVGWFVCAQFASVGYYWTFYYMLALIVAARELTLDRFAAAHKAVSRATAPDSRGFGVRTEQPARGLA